MWDLLRADLDDVESLVRVVFEDKEVRWAEHDDDRRASSLRAFLLEETATFPFELKDLQQRFRAERQPGKKIVYRFPKSLSQPLG